MENVKTKVGEAFLAETFVKGNEPSISSFVDGYEVTMAKGASLAISSTEEAPVFFGIKGRLLGAAKIDLERAVSLYIKDKMHTTITAYDLNPKEIEVYIAPCLTFSHTIVERSLIEKMMALGYRAACKRTDGVDFFDVPVAILVQMRELGIPMKNIHISDYDTFENPEMFYSKLHSDEKENVTVATLL